MEAKRLDRIRQGLQRQRERLADWLQGAGRERKEALLGPHGEDAVRARLEVIDGALAKAADRTLGKCTVCRDDVEPALLAVDYTACVCLDHYSPEERRRLERELELAQAVQKMLLPREDPRIPGLEVAAFSRPAQIVGGDYFDFIGFDGGLHGLVVADVAGHGVSASLHMAGIQALLRALVPGHRSPAAVLRQVHRLFIHNARFDSFVTFFIGAFDAAGRTLTFCNAGHPPPLVIHPARPLEEAVQTLPPTAAAVGLVEEAVFAERRVTLQPGDLILLYTDGVTEALDARGQAYGRPRLARLAGETHGRSAPEVLQALRRDWEDFCGRRPPADDLTLVVGRVQ